MAFRTNEQGAKEFDNQLELHEKMYQSKIEDTASSTAAEHCDLPTPQKTSNTENEANWYPEDGYSGIHGNKHKSWKKSMERCDSDEDQEILLNSHNRLRSISNFILHRQSPIQHEDSSDPDSEVQSVNHTLNDMSECDEASAQPHQSNIVNPVTRNLTYVSNDSNVELNRNYTTTHVNLASERTCQSSFISGTVNGSNAGLASSGFNPYQKPYFKRLRRERTKTYCLLSLVFIVLVIYISAVGLLCLRLLHINNNRTITHATIQSFALLPDWEAMKTADWNKTINITWLLRDKLHQFVILDTSRHRITLIENGTYHLHLSLNVDTSHASRSMEKWKEHEERFQTLICLQNSRYLPERCQRLKLPSYTAVTIAIDSTEIFYKGDYVWVTVFGFDHVYQSSAMNYFTLTRWS